MHREISGPYRVRNVRGSPQVVYYTARRRTKNPPANTHGNGRSLIAGISLKLRRDATLADRVRVIEEISVSRLRLLFHVPNTFFQEHPKVKRVFIVYEVPRDQKKPIQILVSINGNGGLSWKWRRQEGEKAAWMERLTAVRGYT